MTEYDLTEIMKIAQDSGADEIMAELVAIDYVKALKEYVESIEIEQNDNYR